MGEHKRSYQDICGNVFTLSKYVGVFPIGVTKDRINKIPSALIATIILLICIIIFGILSWPHLIASGYQINKNTLATKAQILTLTGMAYVPMVSILWITIKIKTFTKVIQALLKIENVTSHSPDPNNIVVTSCFIIIMILLQVFANYVINNSSTSVPFYMIRLFYFLSILVVQQFTSILKHIRSHYNYLVSTANMENAELWTKCHEVLGSCCSAITDCYAPQLLIYFLALFVNFISDSYMVVSLIKNQGPPDVICLYVLAIANQCLTIWYILFNCRDSLVKAKKFDKILYRMVINDDSKVLLRNKRIQIHFKGKRNEEFSAMGFFNFDYPLICSMVCSATTYIVILVQFS